MEVLSDVNQRLYTVFVIHAKAMRTADTTMVHFIHPDNMGGFACGDDISFEDVSSLTVRVIVALSCEAS